MKKFISLFLVVAVVLSTFTVTFAAAGTEADPVLISSVSELVAAANEINADGAEGKYYKLTADINFDGADWKTFIGTADVPFKGVFDGNGHVIKNVKIPDEGKTNVNYGIFGVIDGNAVVKNVGVENLELYKAYTGVQYGHSAFGGLVATVSGSAKVDNCYAKNVTIDTKVIDTNVWSGFYGDHLEYAGGLVGLTNGAGVEITNCYSINFVEINDSAANNSFLVAYANSGTFAKIENCYANGPLAQCVAADATKVVNCYTTDTSTWCSLGTRPGTLVTDAVLKTKHTDLGAAYKEGPSYNDGYPVLAWQPDAQKMAGSGTEQDPYVIETRAHLVEASLITETEGVYFELAKDIDLENKVWNTYIGSEEYPFKGKFDGKGHVIRNVAYDVPGYENSGNARVGIFGVVGGNGLIMDLGVETINVGATATWGWNAIVGGLAGKLIDNAAIDGCYVKDMIINTKDASGKSLQPAAAGSIAGLVDGEGVLIASSFALGFKELNSSVSTEDGLVGQAVKFAAITDCYSDTTLACVATDYADNVTNSYCTTKASWAADGYTRAGTVKSISELKGMAEALGGAYKKGGMETKGLPALNWMTVTAITIAEGSGTYEDPYIVKTAADLSAIADFEETAGIYFKLMNDIDLNGQVWESYIGSKDAPFEGDFNGNGHVIKNYTLKVAGTVERGIFNAVGGNAYIHDLGIENVTVTLASNCGWDSTAGGLIACLYGNAVVAGCYVKNIVFNAEYKRTEYWHVELKWGGGLIGYGDGDGIEIRDCYSNGFVESYEEGTKAIVNNEGGLFGMLDSFLALEDCYSDTTMGRYTLDGLSKNSFHAGPTLEWPEGYHWGYASHILDVTTLGYDWNNDFVPGENDLPMLKWEENDGYVNLIPGGEMTGVDPSVFGVGNGLIVVSDDASRKSTVLKLPANSLFKYNVDLEEGQYYRVSFRGKALQADQCGITFDVGGIDLTQALVDKTLGQLWKTKVVYIKAEADNADLTISADADFCIDDVEIIKVNADLEVAAIEKSVIFEKTYADVTQEIFIANPICDGLELHIESDYDCVDRNGKLNKNVPVGFGTVDIEVSIKAIVADKVPSAKKVFTINKLQPYDVKTLGLVNADGEKVFGVSAAEKIGTVKVDVNTDDAGSIVAALYKDGKLIAMKQADVVDGESVIDLPVGDADKVKVFAYVADTLMPLSVPEVTYDKLTFGGNAVMHTIGDSLCSTYDPEKTDMVGWGQVIGSKLDKNYITVDNDLAESGMTANKFFGTGGARGGINELVAKFKQGDYLFVQLGTNDSSGYLADLKGFTKEQFRFYMDQFVTAARERGTIPVFVTAPERLSIVEDTKTDGENFDVNSILENYPDIMREYGEDYNVPVIDLNAESNRLLKQYGYTGTKELGIFVADELHFTETGANWIADFVVSELVRLGLPVGDCVLEK